MNFVGDSFPSWAAAPKAYAFTYGTADESEIQEVNPQKTVAPRYSHNH